MKTPGQVGYEAMLELLRDNAGIPGHDPDWRLKQDTLEYGKWELQSEKCRADWEFTAHAILAECCDLEKPRGGE